MSQVCTLSATAAALSLSNQYRENLGASLYALEHWLLQDRNAELLTLWDFLGELVDLRERGDWQHDATGFRAYHMRVALHSTLQPRATDETLLYANIVSQENREELRFVIESGAKSRWLVEDVFGLLLGIDISGSHLNVSLGPNPSTRAVRNFRSGRGFHIIAGDDWQSITVTERFIELVPPTSGAGVPDPVGKLAEVSHLHRNIEAYAHDVLRVFGLDSDGDGPDNPAVDPEQLRNELECEEVADRMLHAGELLLAVTASNGGRLLVSRLLDDKSHPLNPERLLDAVEADGGFSFNADARRALLELCREWLPVLIQEGGKRPERLIALTSRVLGAALGDVNASAVLNEIAAAPSVDDTVASAAHLAKVVGKFEEAMNKAEQSVEVLTSSNSRANIELGKNAGVLIQLAKVFLVVHKRQKSPTLETDVAVAEEIVSLVNSLFDIHVSQLERLSPDPKGDARIQRQRLLARRISVAIALFDMVGYGLRANEAWRSGDRGQAVGLTVSALGSATGAVAVLVMGTKLAALAGPLGWAALILGLVGWAIVVHFRQAPLIGWLERTAFGKRWHLLTAEGTPGEDTFRWWRDGRPDYVRQVQGLRSLVTGIEVRGWQEGEKVVRACTDTTWLENYDARVYPVTIAGPSAMKHYLMQLRAWHAGNPAPSFICTVQMHPVPYPWAPNSPPPSWAHPDLRNIVERMFPWFRVRGMRSQNGVFHWDIRLRMQDSEYPVPNHRGTGVPGGVSFLEIVLLDAVLLNDEEIRQEVGVARTGDQVGAGTRLDHLIAAGAGLVAAQEVDWSGSMSPCLAEPAPS